MSSAHGAVRKLTVHAHVFCPSAASRLAAAISASSDCRLAWPVESNELFAIVPPAIAAEWKARSVGCYAWPLPGDLVETVSDEEMLLRLVTSFASSEEEVAEFERMLGLQPH